MPSTFTPLSEDEIIILNAFDKYGELLMPEWIFKDIFPASYLHKLLVSLEKKKVIIKAKPYKLSKLGRLLKKRSADCAR